MYFVLYCTITYFYNINNPNLYIYLYSILKAAETRHDAAKENVMDMYFDDYLDDLHGDLMHEDRTRSLAANCKILPPIPPTKYKSASKMRKKKSKRKQK